MQTAESLLSIGRAAIVFLALASTSFRLVGAETVFPVEQSASEFPEKNIGSQKALIAPINVLAQSRVVELFNGKDFSGWTFHSRTNSDPSATWTITNGVIHCSGQPFGYMRTEQSFQNYKLTVEWRFVKTAPRADNTGILLHVQSPDKIWPRAIECQGQSRRHGDLILMGGATCKVDGQQKSGRVAMKGDSNEKPVGEWNTYEIICQGDTMKVSVNGKLLNEAADCSVSSGFIAIQSEGGEFEVRRVTLERLGAL